MIELPNGVHRVVARAREYFYWHPGRGTKHAGERVRNLVWLIRHQLRAAFTSNSPAGNVELLREMAA